MERRADDLQSIILRLASPETIRSWSSGEVLKPETINYRTQRPERDGLFCERIFGPTKDFECYCGKYRRIRYKGVVCDKCGVEVTRSIVRRERMAHIDLASPVAHIWFVRSIPSRIGLLLDLSIADLEKIIYFAGYIVTVVNEKERAAALKAVQHESKLKAKETTKSALREATERARNEIKILKPHTVLSEVEYHKLSLKYGNVFEAETGAEALKKIIERLDLLSLGNELEEKAKNVSPAIRKKILQRLRLIKSLLKARSKPEWMFLTALPVIPPDLRPMVPLDGGRHASSDVNDLYRRVINRNNRLKRLFELGAPEVITRNEKRMLQEAVDALLDNSMRRGGSPVNAHEQRRPLRSLADMLKGKQGRFRQNLLGKRVDYSGRSVIVVGADLKLHQCGLPKHMALELFRPFVIQKIVARELAYNIRGAGKLIDEATSEVWAILEEVIEDKFVLLNSAPTLHRLGIQAFKPLLVEGNAIELHPLVCQAFNADFDGDQMAVHVPLTDEAQKEARDIMTATRNLLKPGTGESIAVPTQDVVLGCYWLTHFEGGAKGEGRIFSSKNEAVLAHDVGDVALRARVQIVDRKSSGSTFLLETSVGRILFNAVLPDGYDFINEVLNKRKLTSLIDILLRKYESSEVCHVLDRIKEIGFEYATRSGISWGMEDLTIHVRKDDLIQKGQKEVHTIQEQYNNGFLTEDERYIKVVEVWSNVTKEISDDVPKTLDKDGPVYYMVNSSARGSWGSITQMSALRGLMRNPAGRIIELPILSSYKEGLSVFEYFISTHGARKGTADTALKTAVAGYLTRRLVDVSHDVVVIEEDCKVKEGVEVCREDLEREGVLFRQRIFGRTLLEAVRDQHENSIIFKKGHLISPEDAERIDNMGVRSVFLRSPVTCQTKRGVCRKCYGYDLGHNEFVNLGEAVGVVAAQAIGEPGTQLTMRTFHTGGAVGAGGTDITLGLPRVQEIFETRIPKNSAVITEIDGQVLDITVKKNREKVVSVMKTGGGSKKSGTAAKDDVIEYAVPFGRMVAVKKGDTVKVGNALSDGPLELKILYETAGKSAVVRYILNEVLKMYTLQGAAINQKHIEIIVRQMFSRVRVIKPNDTAYAEGEILERSTWMEENDKIIAAGGQPSTAEEILMGITKVALTTTSFLSAASFQETSKVLIRAALEGREDTLLGLKENVIIGRLIPAGTGFHRKK